MKARISFLLAVFFLGACAFGGGPKASRMVYSPNGEPLTGGPLGRLSCAEALGGWFDRVSGARGTLDRSAFMADAAAQFARMDLDGDGVLYSAELERYRAPYRQGLDPLREPKLEHESFKRSKAAHRAEAAPSVDVDPVMSADLNNDFKVTREEYFAQSLRVFDETDRSHTGTLTRGEVLRACVDN